MLNECHDYSFSRMSETDPHNNKPQAQFNESYETKRALGDVLSGRGYRFLWNFQLLVCDSSLRRFVDLISKPAMRRALRVSYVPDLAITDWLQIER